MLHVLPIRLILRLIAIFVFLVVLAAFSLGWVDDHNRARSVAVLMRGSAVVVTFAVVALHVSWRCLPVLQRALFPYLGGRWSGVIQFSTPGGTDSRHIVLEIKHTL